MKIADRFETMTLTPAVRMAPGRSRSPHEMQQVATMS